MGKYGFEEDGDGGAHWLSVEKAFELVNRLGFQSRRVD